jgi:predicted kinase
VLPSIPCVKFAGAIKSIPKQHVAKEYKAKRQETIASVEFIQTLLNNQSAFRSDLGPVEGVVLRQDEAQWLKHRFKVVRSDFKAGIEERCHWSRRTIKKQRIDFVFQHFYIQQCYPFSDRIMSERTMPRHGTPRQHRQPPRCIMLAGLPGSGKSSFAMSLSESLNLNHLGRIKTLIANQDLLGRKQCQRVAGQASSKYRVIVDRCNLTTKERREWFQIMHSPSPDDISLVFFNVPADICARRVQLRLGHATMQQGKGSSTLLEQLSEQFEPPSEQEKCNMFGTIRIITSWDDACSLLEEWVPKT